MVNNFDSAPFIYTISALPFLLKEFQIKKEIRATKNAGTYTLLTYWDAIHMDLYLSNFTISKK
ncbi:MAG: hypothetical protein Fur0028_05690 [Bacteroidales bacterium]